MKKFLTDVHTHSAFSHDSTTPIEEMLTAAYKKGMAFYGIAEHFDYDVLFGKNNQPMIDAEAYFHKARHLQENYAGCMNVLVGAEFGYSDNEDARTMYAFTYEKYHPDFVVNSVHGMKGDDYYYRALFGEKSLLSKAETYGAYLGVVRRSLDAPYPYDVVGHIGYLTRYAPYPDRTLGLAEFGAQIDDILKTIVTKDKILELNTSSKGAPSTFLPSKETLRRYFELGGRKVSIASDAHGPERIADKREEAVALLRSIGFTYFTVPCRGEHIKVEI